MFATNPHRSRTLHKASVYLPFLLCILTALTSTRRGTGWSSGTLISRIFPDLPTSSPSPRSTCDGVRVPGTADSRDSSRAAEAGCTPSLLHFQEAHRYCLGPRYGRLPFAPASSPEPVPQASPYQPPKVEPIKSPIRHRRDLSVDNVDLTHLATWTQSHWPTPVHESPLQEFGSKSNGESAFASALQKRLSGIAKARDHDLHH